MKRLYFKTKESALDYVKSEKPDAFETDMIPCACGQSWGIRLFNAFDSCYMELIVCESCYNDAPFIEQSEYYIELKTP